MFRNLGKLPFRGRASPIPRPALPLHRPCQPHTEHTTLPNIAHPPHMLNQVCGVCAMLPHGSTLPFPAVPLLTSAHHCKNFASIIFLWCSPSLAHTQPIHNSNSPSLKLVYPCQRNGPGIPNKCNIPLCTVQINFLFLIFFCKFLIINLLLYFFY